MERTTPITDTELLELQCLVNHSVHELVFAFSHMEQSSQEGCPVDREEIASALDCLNAVTLNLDQAKTMLTARPGTPIPVKDGTGKTVAEVTIQSGVSL